MVRSDHLTDGQIRPRDRWSDLTTCHMVRSDHGNPWPGQPLPGQPLLGQPLPGQPLPGQPLPGQPLPRQPLPGQLATEISARTYFVSRPVGTDWNPKPKGCWGKASSRIRDLSAGIPGIFVQENRPGHPREVLHRVCRDNFRRFPVSDRILTDSKPFRLVCP